MTSSKNKRIIKNTLFLYIRMFIVLIISLYTSRIILNTLGIKDYGIYSTIAGFVSMFAFINATLSASMQRFYNYEGTQTGLEGYKKVYTCGLVIHLIIGVILFVLLETFGLWYVNNIMVIPSDRLYAANIVFQFSTLSLLFLIFQIPYVGAILATEKMNYYSIVSIIDIICRLICVLLLSHISHDKLIIYSVLLFIITVFNFLLYVIYAKKYILHFKFYWKFDMEFFNKILFFSGWNLLGTFSFLLKGQGINILLNLYFGPLINAARGIAYQINSAVTNFTNNITMAYRPQIVNSYSENNMERVKSLFFSESKICFALITVLIIPIIHEIEYILKIWLGTVPEYTNIFSILILIDSLICTLNTPCSQVISATGQIKKFQIASSVVNICLMPASWICLEKGLDASSVFIATICFSILNQIICLIILKNYFKFEYSHYIKEIILPCFKFCFFLIAITIPIKYIFPDSLLRLLLVVFTTVILGCISAYYIILNEEEKKNISKIIKNKIKWLKYQS